MFSQVLTKLNQKEVKEMAKMTAWLVTIIGILLVLEMPGIGITTLSSLAEWIIPLAIVVIGIGKLVRSYNYKKRR